jgi:hypothetical protein
MAKANKAIPKSGFVDKNLQTALERLAVAAAAVDKAVAVRARDAKKYGVTTKRLSKRKTALTKRKRLAAGRVKKNPSGDTRRALRAVEKELTSTTKELAKARIVKSANAEELALLKASQRRTSGYTKGIAQVDRALAKK